VPAMLQALDVGVVCNRDSAFGRYCYPQKAVEMIGCALPICMAKVGVARELMGECRPGLYRPGDAADLARAIAWQLERGCLPQSGDRSWDALVDRVNALLERVCGSHDARRQEFR
jgi:hypothetical protein